HFPIGLLLMAAPLLLLIAVIVPPASRQFAAAAAVVFVIGTAGLWVAAQSGGAAYQLAKSQGALEDPAIAHDLKEHAELGVTSRNYFTAFSIALLLYLLVPLAAKREVPAGLHSFVLLLFLVGSAVL